MRRSLRILIAVAVILLAAAAVYQPPYVIVAPGPAVELTEDVTIEGVPAEKPDERYFVVTVSLRRPSALRLALSRLNPEIRILAEAELIPPGVTREQYSRHQDMLFRESQTAAAAAAAMASGMEVTLDGRGARIFDIAEGSPAEAKLRVGDVIKAINGSHIRLASDLTAITTTRPPGAAFEVKVERSGRELSFRIRSSRLEGFNAAATGIGVRTTTHRLHADLPFDIRFEPRPLAGPSAGLAYALAIADMLDGARPGSNRRIAATGAIYPNGEVGPVGAIAEKGRVAAGVRAELFLVPEGEAGPTEAGVDTRGVGTLDEALSAVRGL